MAAAGTTDSMYEKEAIPVMITNAECQARE